MPDFDFDAFNHEEVYGGEQENAEKVANGITAAAETPPPVANTAASIEEVDKW
jgi:hypothetical protein